MIWVCKKIGHRTESGVAGRYSGMILIWFSWAWWDILRSIVFVVEKAEDFNNAGNDAYRKKDFAKAIFFYTEGIKVECKDKELVSKLHNNRSTVYFYRGKCLKINNTQVDPWTLILFTLILLRITFWKKPRVASSFWSSSRTYSSNILVRKLFFSPFSKNEMKRSYQFWVFKTRSFQLAPPTTWRHVRGKM